jgi:hydroxymethylpyrimidine pyrophosphatase-like HAD family hydrolase
MKDLLLFDVDGTLAESSQMINDKMRDMLITKKSQGYDIGVVGGGKIDKVLCQLNGVSMNHYFTECGCIYHIIKDDSPSNNISLVNQLSTIHKKNIRDHELYPQINKLVKQCLHFLSKVDYTISGHFVDLRCGILYISLIGMSATLDEREVFKKLDSEHSYRKKIISILKDDLMEMGISDRVSVYEGGQVGISIFPSEYDKVQVIPEVTHKYDKIHYFGDKYEDNGNDQLIINHSSIIGHPVDTPQDTIDILSSM